MIITILGAVVLVVAIYALNQQPNGKSVGNAAASRTGATRTSTAAPSSGSRSAGSRSSTAAKSSKATKSSTSKTNPPSSPGTDSTGAAKQVPLIVLNNTTTQGLANTAASQFRNGGWTVSDTGNLRNDIASTCAYYDPSADGAKAAAEVLQQQYPTIKRVEKRFPELPQAPIVVVLTPGYSSN